MLSSKNLPAELRVKVVDPTTGTQDCTSSSFLTSLDLQMQCLLIKDSHRFREMSSNEQHLCTYFGDFKQFRDVFVVKANAAI